MHAWQYALEFLKADGWNHQLGEQKSDRLPGALPLVELSRNGINYTVEAATVDEAVGILYGFILATTPDQRPVCH